MEFQCQKVIGNGRISGTAPWVGWMVFFILWCPSWVDQKMYDLGHADSCRAIDLMDVTVMRSTHWGYAKSHSNWSHGHHGHEVNCSSPIGVGLVRETATVVVSRDKIKLPKMEFQCQKVIGYGQMSGMAPWVGWNWLFFVLWCPSWVDQKMYHWGYADSRRAIDLHHYQSTPQAGGNLSNRDKATV
jgi:hypothetical protein